MTAAQAGLAHPGREGRLADRHAHPADRGPYSISEVCFLIDKATGEQVSYTTIWKLGNGQSQNPSKRLIEPLARTFGVPPAFFFDDYDEEQLGLLKEQVELLTLIRDAKITSAELRALLGLEQKAAEQSPAQSSGPLTPKHSGSPAIRQRPPITAEPLRRPRPSGKPRGGMARSVPAGLPMIAKGLRRQAWRRHLVRARRYRQRTRVQWR